MDYFYEWKLSNETKFFYLLSKSLFDRVVATATVILLLPLFVLVSLLIVVTTSGSPFYSQIRTGQYGRPFRIYKFRTMVTGTKRAYLLSVNEMQGGMLKARADVRITKVGRHLRRWSIDELPQLFNIVKGDMSIVGPRPLSAEDSCVIPEKHMIRFAAMPGLTGFWQATARDSLNGLHKISLDAEYAKTRCWKVDAVLILKTIPTIFKGTGAW